ncbi:phenoloxidase subunit 1-like [Cloeon dipterum]|uniref:phenoloxidase subunit 1-like n=1 Tax=Cloeon dipterum TaxID=197152 RepID=UPI00322060F1
MLRRDKGNMLRILGTPLAYLLIFTHAWSSEALDPQMVTLALLDRIHEPILIPKGERYPIAFNVPNSYISSNIQPFQEYLQSEASMSTVYETIKIQPNPNIEGAIKKFGALPKTVTFTTFIPMHMELASELTEFFIGQNTSTQFFTTAAAVRDNINPGLFVHAFSLAVTHRSDCLNVKLPPLYEIFPGKFFSSASLTNMRQTAMMLVNSGPSQRNLDKAAGQAFLDLENNPTASDREPEHKLAYFREDVGLNLHHWNWHLMYPFSGPKEIVNKDRRGELFYYAHQQIMARYNFERLTNSMLFTEKISDFKAPIKEGYFPKLFTNSATKNWAARAPYSVLKDIDREADEVIFEIRELEEWRARIMDTIYKGRAQNPDGTTQVLDAFGGIDILGNIVEPTVHGINLQYYNNFHNFLHLAIAWSHDPTGTHLETVSVIGETQTAMRDPVFYRIHGLVNYMFQQHKDTLPSYTTSDLEFKKISLVNLEIVTDAKPNTFYTFWGKRQVDLSRGLDFFPRNPVSIQFKHLDHRNFSYYIKVNSDYPVPKKALIRIFLGPKFGDTGEELSFNKQRKLFFELDKFDVTLKKGYNTIIRKSIDSTVTVPFAQSAKTLEYNESTSNDPGRCGCGWPHNLLIPKGNQTGYPGVIFAMVSDYGSDIIAQTIRIQAGECKIAASYCGIFNKKYPDKRAMGYPFDRASSAKTLSEFIIPNMYTRVVNIVHEDVTKST